MSPNMWVLAILVLVGFTIIGGYATAGWRKSNTKAARVNLVLAVFFLIAGLVGILDIIHLTAQIRHQQARIEEQIACSAEFNRITKVRSEARIIVDENTIHAFHAVIGMLSDMKEGDPIDVRDQHTQDAIDALKKAADARESPDLRVLPNCKLEVGP